MRFTVLPNEAGMRLDKLLCGKLPGIGRATVKRLFVDARVRLVREGGSTRRAAKGDVAAEGQVVEVDVAVTDVTAVPDPDAPLTVVLETDQIVVMDKPAGQPTAPLAPGERGALANALLARYPDVASCGFSPREPGLCHRLDTGTSGLVLAARSAPVFEVLTKALKDGRLDKRYYLLVLADGLPESGTIDIPIAAHPKDRRRVLPCLHPRDVDRNNPRAATTTWTKIREHGPLALVEARAPRALRHQIRAHLSAIGHPLIGDALYGGDMSFGLARHALHAQRIAWGGDPVIPAFVCQSPLPPDMAKLAGDAPDEPAAEGA